MPIQTRRGAIVATGATLLAAAVGRKLWAQDGGGEGDGLPDPPSLPDLSGLQRFSPPRALPAFGFTDGDGRARTLADYAGRGVVLNLWATWCMPCVAELPALDGLARAVAADHVAVLPLSSDRGGASTVRRFFATHEVQSLPVMLDPDMVAAHALGVRGVPTTLLVSPDGREVARLEGGAEWGSDAAVATVRALIGPSAGAGARTKAI